MVAKIHFDGRSSKAAQLRQMITSPELEFLLEAHNGISARIAEEAGFKGIWASGLALSAQFGVRDNNEASWTQVVDMLEFMADITHIPILLDGDTGYGNFNNMRRLVHKLEQRGIAGVCIEDKLFPKTNSFIGGERQPLAEIDEFCGKIKAGKDCQRDEDFCIIARVEALIAGWEVDEAVRRAGAYHEAGADAILIHSKRSQPDEILAFIDRWENRAPVVIAPTKYYSTPTDVFRRAGVSMVIWANHQIRSAVQAMQASARRIYRDQSLLEVEDTIAPMDEIFRLQGAEELRAAERRYSKSPRAETAAIVLGATRGKGLGDLTADRPKMMVNVAGRPLLRRLVDEFRRQRIRRIVAVVGYHSETVDVPGINRIENPAFETSGELASLACALPAFTDKLVICYGDLLFRRYILQDLLDSDGELSIVVDAAYEHLPISGTPDYVVCSRPDDLEIWRKDVSLRRMSNDAMIAGERAHGRWIGLLHARGRGVELLRQAIEELRSHARFKDYTLPNMLNHLIDRGHKIQVNYCHGHWLDVNSLHDLEHADRFATSD
ncbi:phosphoenolpyruvate phosphomutase [Nitrococcus mobilis Nb-231]|uniref:phosphoenolpyruvate mutase n=2 Tax=Nitrococcus mobilis TaxID=35797 RepID=A4BTB7_9GAMM|nr:phosphoenolpyruvate mutase [Nitrococcus mobilis]EAR21019.1 phosphoenolpyruvate phosphomutase [Nitrococcus mobilis Nb-231]